MGDRANVFIRGTSYNQTTNQELPAATGIWLYGHWSGYNLPLAVQDALRKKARWTDESYLTRIIFCQMLKRGYSSREDALEDTASFGIGLTMPDSEYPILVLDIATQRIGFSPEPKSYKDQPPTPKVSWSFEEFCEAKPEDILILRDSIKCRD